MYPRRENFYTLRMSNLIRFKVGFADHRAHPDGITGLPASLSTVCQRMIVSGGDSNPDVGGGRVSRTPPYRPLVCVPELD